MLFRCLALLICLLSGIDSVGAENRVALVIGNANYTLLGDKLPNDINDANDMATILTNNFGFHVIKRNDAKLEDILEGLASFSRELEKGGVGLFYYSGHGLEVDGQQYIVPVDVGPLKSKEYARYRLIDITSILKQLDESKSNFNILILDSCRDNPFAKSLGLKSLNATGFSPPVKFPSGTLIASATASGSTSSASGERNSVYTAQLLRYLREEPGEEIRSLLGDVGEAVEAFTENTENQQVPWVVTSMKGRFFFAKNHQEPLKEINLQASINKLYKNGISNFEFGSSPDAINSKLVPPFATVAWNDLPVAGEYKRADVRYFFRPLSEFRNLPFQDLYRQCGYDGSYLLFMFDSGKLFNISLRLSDSCSVSRQVVEQIASTHGLQLITDGGEVRFNWKGETVQLSGASSSNWFTVIDWSLANSAYPPP